MIGFGWAPGLLLAGAAVLPLVLHLLHRTRWRPVAWPAMRLLDDLATRRASRLAVEDLLLLALRVLLLVLIALAVARPQWTPPVAVEDAGGPLAGVLLVDDSLAAAARDSDGRPRLAAQQALAAAWLEGPATS